MPDPGISGGPPSGLIGLVTVVGGVLIVMLAGWLLERATSKPKPRPPTVAVQPKTAVKPRPPARTPLPPPTFQVFRRGAFMAPSAQSFIGYRGSMMEQQEQLSEFEAVKTRLEEIAEAVDDENLSLDEALDLYEEAVAIGLRASDLLEVGIVAPEEDANGDGAADADGNAASEAAPTNAASAPADADAQTAQTTQA